MNRKSKKQERVIIFDTTLRDGEQAPGFHMSVAEKVRMAEQLARLGVDVIEAGFPVSSPSDFEAVETIARTVGQRVDAPEICGLARCVSKDIQAVWNSVKFAERPRIHVFIATSNLHMTHKLRMTPSEVIEKIRRSVGEASSLTRSVEFSAEDASRSNRDFLVEVVETAIEAGATTVNIPDTVGFAAPEEYANLIRFIKGQVRNIDRAVISVHGQNDLGMAVANSLAAVSAGARQVECTINGIGERAGNCSLEEVVMNMKVREDYYGVVTGINTKQIAATSAMLSEIVNAPVSANKAIVGSNAFAHGSGVHQDGVMKNPTTYEIIRPEDVGAAGSKIILTSRSGSGALMHRIQKLGFVVREAEQMAIYDQFKKIADKKKIIQDEDLIQMMTIRAA